jgi:UDP-N-acetylglucosamine:LPS N-acetylglucosamine transferase
VAHPSVSDFEPLDRPIADLLCSVDAVLAKPGYGTFAEAACNGTPLLYLRRKTGRSRIS